MLLSSLAATVLFKLQDSVFNYSVPLVSITVRTDDANYSRASDLGGNVVFTDLNLSTGIKVEVEVNDDRFKSYKKKIVIADPTLIILIPHMALKLNYLGPKGEKVVGLTVAVKQVDVMVDHGLTLENGSFVCYVPTYLVSFSSNEYVFDAIDADFVYYADITVIKLASGVVKFEDTVVLKLNFAFRFKVTDSDANPLVGVNVQLYTPSTDPQYLINEVTNKFGETQENVVVDEFQAGVVYMIFIWDSAHDYRPFVEQFVKQEGVLIKNLNVSLANNVHASFVLRDSKTLDPVKQTNVQIIDEQNKLLYKSTTDDNGRFDVYANKEVELHNNQTVTLVVISSSYSSLKSDGQPFKFQVGFKSTFDVLLIKNSVLSLTIKFSMADACRAEAIVMVNKANRSTEMVALSQNCQVVFQPAEHEKKLELNTSYELMVRAPGHEDFKSTINYTLPNQVEVIKLKAIDEQSTIIIAASAGGVALLIAIAVLVVVVVKKPGKQNELEIPLIIEDK